MTRARAQTLPRGRHRLSRETVMASQRTRLLEAMVALSAEVGYSQVTITGLVARARVARRTFYAHFGSKEACFLAAYDYTAEQIIGPLMAAYDPVDEVRERVGRYLRAGLELFSARPALARMLVIEVGAGGPEAVRRRLEMHRRVADALVSLNERTRQGGVQVPAISHSRALAIVGALIELMHAALADHGPDGLPAIRDELSEIVTALIYS